MAGLIATQNMLVGQIKEQREYTFDNEYVLAEYPASSGNFFSCSISSQDNWSKLGTLDTRGLVTYPFTVTTNDERGSYAILDSGDLSGAIATISSSVFTERTLAQSYMDAVLAATTDADAFAAAQPYLDL